MFRNAREAALTPGYIDRRTPHAPSADTAAVELVSVGSFEAFDPAFVELDIADECVVGIDRFGVGHLLLVDRQFGAADISEWKTEPHPSCSLDGMAVVASDLSVEDFAALPGIVDRLFEVQQSGRTQTETKSGTQPVADVAPFPDCYPQFSTNAAIAEDGGYVSLELALRISRVYAPWPGTVLVELSRSDTEVQ